MRSAVFIERDGILNEVRVVRGYPVSPRRVEEFVIRQGIRPVLEAISDAGLVLVVTTNQPGVSQGLVDRRELDRMHDLLKCNLPVDEVLVCPHSSEDECPCRKPLVGLFEEAAFKWHLDLDHSYVVSDKWQDARAAHRLGCRSLLLESPWIGEGHHDFVSGSLEAIGARILELHAVARRVEPSERRGILATASR